MLNLRPRLCLLLASSLLSLGLVACGDSEDPSANNKAPANNNTMNTGTGMGTTGGVTTSPPPGDTTTGPTTGGTVTNTVGPTTTNTNTEPAVRAYGGCNFRNFETGEVERKENVTDFGGGVVVSNLDGYAEDSGITSVLDLFIMKVGDGTIKPKAMATSPEVNTFELDTPIEITDAIVTATARLPGKDSGPEANRLPRKYYIQDKKRAIAINLEDPKKYLSGVGEEGKPRLTVGSKISFKVRKIGVFGSGYEPQIEDISDLKVTAAGVNVGVIDITGQEPAPEDYAKLVRVYGKLEGEPNTTTCGNAQCWNLLHGDAASPKTLLFRVNSAANVKKDSCVSFLGPYNTFPSPYKPNDTGKKDSQLDASNFSWFTSFLADK